MVAAVPDLKTSSLRRLRRIEGQVRGLQKMVEQERACGDILVQVASVREALRGVARELMRNHVRRCPESPAEVKEELLELMVKYWR